MTIPTTPHPHPRTARQMLDEAVMEADLQKNIRRLAAHLGWRCFHPYDSRRSTAGWPDLALCKPGDGERTGRLILAELKREREQPTPDQRDWLAALGTVPAVEVVIWRPSDWSSGRVENVLKGEREA